MVTAEFTSMARLLLRGFEVVAANALRWFQVAAGPSREIPWLGGAFSVTSVTPGIQPDGAGPATDVSRFVTVLVWHTPERAQVRS
jgi:hypothetical protein